MNTPIKQLLKGAEYMKDKLCVGSESYEEIIHQNGYFVDKTELIYELAAETSNKVTLFTRPRRFGKTLMMSMMESFFDIRRDSRKVFDGKNVMNHPEFCSEYMNQFPVIFITFKDVDGKNYDLAYKKLTAVISELCIRLSSVLDSDLCDPADREIFEKMRFKKASEEEVQFALRTLMRMMYAVYGKPVILLIDEYDVPLAKAHTKGYYHDMLDLIRCIMSTSLKTNDYLKFAVVTGCLRIPKESIFTGVNNFASYSVLEERFAQYFGFTTSEVNELLENFGLMDKAPVIKAWYDGYLFGSTEVYCPWDVISYVSDLLFKRDMEPDVYWENTGSSDAISAFFELENVDISDSFETLLNGGTITETVSTALTYDTAYTNVSNLWSVLLMTGYVTPVSQSRGLDAKNRRTVELRIPNTEVAHIFQGVVDEHFNQTVDRSQVTALLNALWKGEVEEAQKILSDLLWLTISYMDYHENFYHAFLAGIFVGGGYKPKSNKERGLGRPDIDLRDKRKRSALIIETKRSETEEQMEYWCDEALRQIKNHEYDLHLDEYEHILRYGIAFYKKKAMIKKM